MKIDSNKYELKLYYRYKSFDDMKFSIVSIEDDDNVELIF